MQFRLDTNLPEPATRGRVQVNKEFRHSSAQNVGAGGLRFGQTLQQEFEIVSPRRNE